MCPFHIASFNYLKRFVASHPPSMQQQSSSWQRKGHTSLNGVVTVIAVNTGKAIDVRINAIVGDSEHLRKYEKILMGHLLSLTMDK
ncbi:hypothetical protein J6590_060649 [Homalodisca vitripennis]|nr:hypothetical protein J6590_060649 [Homalodisca vitripennis]